MKRGKMILVRLCFMRVINLVAAKVMTLTAVIRREGILFLVLVFAGMFTARALAQQSGIARIEIRALDASSFPEVALTAGIFTADGEPATPEELHDLEVLEDGALVSYSAAQAAAPLELLVALDAGSGITAPGATGEARLDEMKSFLLALVDGALQPDDRLGILLVTPGSVSTLQELTTDYELLRQTLSALSLTATSEVTDSISAAVRGLGELQASANHAAVRQRLLILSMGVQSGSEGAVGLSELALQLEIPLDAVLFRGDAAPHARLLRELAGESGGYYLHFSGVQSTAEYFTLLRLEHQVSRISYRSVSRSRAPRTVELRLRQPGASPLGDQRSYQVELQRPQVTIEAPPDGAEIVRLPEASALSYPVAARIAWLDGYPRLLSQAQLWLDDRLAQVWLPAAGEDVSTEWDLQPYGAAGQTVRLQILVRDELGLESSSAPVTVRLSAQAPAPEEIAPAAENCSDKTALRGLWCQLATLPAQQLILLLTLALVILLAGLVIVRLIRAPAASKIRPRDHETNTRLTAPVDDQVGAFLEVISGDDSLQGKLIPLYANRVTPVGRSPHEAELVFQVNNERSVISRLHCEFKETNGLFTLRDLGSSRGTYLNGRRMLPASDAITLRDSDQIELGPALRGGLLLVFHTLDSPLLKPQDSPPR